MSAFEKWANRNGHDAQRICSNESSLHEVMRKGFASVEGDLYLIERLERKPKSLGISFYRTPSLSDVDPKMPPARFDTFVRGVVGPHGWLKVGDEFDGFRFLPMEINGKPVVVPAVEPESDALDYDERASRSRFDITLEGRGAMYEVVSEVAIMRRAPLISDDNLIATRRKGRTVELFQWDRSRHWRAAQCPASGLKAWMMLDHAQHGPLLRPPGTDYSWQPMDPVRVAVIEDRWIDLRRFLQEPDAGIDINAQDCDGYTMLMIATASECINCCVVLLEAKADVTLQTRQGLSALDLSASRETAAVVRAMAGQQYLHLDFEQAMVAPELESTLNECVRLSKTLVAKGGHLSSHQDAAAIEDGNDHQEEPEKEGELQRALRRWKVSR